MDKNWIMFGAKLLPFVVTAVHAVEKVAHSHGKDKQDAAVEAIKAGLAAVEAGTERDLLDDAEVDAALRSAIDAYVHLQNVLAAARAKRG